MVESRRLRIGVSRLSARLSNGLIDRCMGRPQRFVRVGVTPSIGQSQVTHDRGIRSKWGLRVTLRQRAGPLRLDHPLCGVGGSADRHRGASRWIGRRIRRFSRSGAHTRALSGDLRCRSGQATPETFGGGPVGYNPHRVPCYFGGGTHYSHRVFTQFWTPTRWNWGSNWEASHRGKSEVAQTRANQGKSANRCGKNGEKAHELPLNGRRTANGIQIPEFDPLPGGLFLKVRCDFAGQSRQDERQTMKEPAELDLDRLSNNDMLDEIRDCLVQSGVIEPEEYLTAVNITVREDGTPKLHEYETEILPNV